MITAPPDPEGFFQGEGFALPSSTPLLGVHPAEIIPHKGLIPVILGHDFEGFPVEESNHSGTLDRNPHLRQASLLEFWTGQRGPDIRTISAWGPFVETINQFHLIENQNVKPLNDSYEISFARLAHRVVRTEATDGSPTEKSGNQMKQKTQRDLRNNIEEFITQYKAQRLQEQDFCERWRHVESENGPILLFLESYLPFTVTLDAIKDSRTWPHYQPQKCWHALNATLEGWISQVEQGESPVPRQNATPLSFIPIFELQWAFLTAATLELICQALLSSEYENYLIMSLLALYQCFNPYSILQWVISENQINRPPHLLLYQDESAFTLIAPAKDKRFISTVQTHWSDHNSCQLYRNVSTWRLTNWEITTLNRQHFTKMALQIWQFLTRVETLWSSRNDATTEIPCWHCQCVLEAIKKNQYVANALDLQVFTKLGLQPFLRAARQYLPWLRQEVKQTYQKHPFLTDPDSVTYRQHLFHGGR